jgi:hypothetical protein
MIGTVPRLMSSSSSNLIHSNGNLNYNTSLPGMQVSIGSNLTYNSMVNNNSNNNSINTNHNSIANINVNLNSGSSHFNRDFERHLFQSTRLNELASLLPQQEQQNLLMNSNGIDNISNSNNERTSTTTTNDSYFQHNFAHLLPAYTNPSYVPVSSNNDNNINSNDSSQNDQHSLMCSYHIHRYQNQNQTRPQHQHQQQQPQQQQAPSNINSHQPNSFHSNSYSNHIDYSLPNLLGFYPYRRLSNSNSYNNTSSDAYNHNDFGQLFFRRNNDTRTNSTSSGYNNNNSSAFSFSSLFNPYNQWTVREQIQIIQRFPHLNLEVIIFKK